MLFSVRQLSASRMSHTTFELRVPELTISQGEKVALVGPSGCGKSTLLDILSLISIPNRVDEFTFSPAGGHRIELHQKTKQNRKLDELALLRRRWIGYVLQTGGLIPFLTVRKNISITRDLLGLPDSGEVDALASSLGIISHLNKMPDMLSVGERQRVAIARSVAHKPAVVIADEPTAALDPKNSERVMELFVGQVEKNGSTLIMASHDVHRVEHFGMRCLEHDLVEMPDQNKVVSIFQG